MPFCSQRANTFLHWLSDNVFRFTKAREPTVRAAQGFSPPFTEADYHARGDKRPKAAPRELVVICRWPVPVNRLYSWSSLVEIG
jgi:hypothetical protein